MKNTFYPVVVLGLTLVYGTFGCAQKMAATKAQTPAPQVGRVWVDPDAVTKILKSGLVYPANKASVLDHLSKTGTQLPAMDMEKLKKLPDKTFMSAEEVIASVATL